MLCTHRCDRLLMLQNRVVKNLFAKYFSSCLYKSMEILKLPDVYRLKINIFMYKVMKLDECPTIKRSLRLEHATHSHNTRTANNLILPFLSQELRL